MLCLSTGSSFPFDQGGSVPLPFPLAVTVRTFTISITLVWSSSESRWGRVRGSSCDHGQTRLPEGTPLEKAIKLTEIAVERCGTESRWVHGSLVLCWSRLGPLGRLGHLSGTSGFQLFPQSRDFRLVPTRDISAAPYSCTEERDGRRPTLGVSSDEPFRVHTVIVESGPAPGSAVVLILNQLMTHLFTFPGLLPTRLTLFFVLVPLLLPHIPILTDRLKLILDQVKVFAQTIVGGARQDSLVGRRCRWSRGEAVMLR